MRPADLCHSRTKSVTKANNSKHPIGCISLGLIVFEKRFETYLAQCDLSYDPNGGSQQYIVETGLVRTRWYFGCIHWNKIGVCFTSLKQDSTSAPITACSFWSCFYQWTLFGYEIWRKILKKERQNGDVHRTLDILWCEILNECFKVQFKKNSSCKRWLEKCIVSFSWDFLKTTAQKESTGNLFLLYLNGSLNCRRSYSQLQNSCKVPGWCGLRKLYL